MILNILNQRRDCARYFSYNTYFFFTNVIMYSRQNKKKAFAQIITKYIITQSLLISILTYTTLCGGRSFCSFQLYFPQVIVQANKEDLEAEKIEKLLAYTTLVLFDDIFAIKTKHTAELSIFFLRHISKSI